MMALDLGDHGSAQAERPVRSGAVEGVVGAEHDGVEDALLGVERIDAPRKALIEVHDAGDPSNHVLAGDILSPDSTDEVMEAVRAHDKSNLEIIVQKDDELDAIEAGLNEKAITIRRVK